MKIIGTTKLTTPCMWTCIGKGIEGLSKYIDTEILIYDDLDFRNGKIKYEPDEVIFIFEAGTPRSNGYTMEHMKEFFPKSKFVILAADTNVFHRRKEHQVNFRYIDLWLDLDEICINTYSKIGLRTDQWLWSSSDWFISYIKNYAAQNVVYTKLYDFIGVYHPGTLNNLYRKDMISFLKEKGYSFTNGGGDGHDDNDLDRLLSYYSLSRITLGTSSHNLARDFRTMKGFRDWIGVYLDTPLIHDDFYMAKNAYGDNIPYFDYYNFEEIINLYDALCYKKYRDSIIEKQKNWVENNTIDKQLVKLLLKHRIINENSLL